MFCSCNCDVERRIKNYSKADKELRELGYSGRWQVVDQWRSTWGFFGIKVQVKEVKIVHPPEMIPHLASRWKTVFVF